MAEIVGSVTEEDIARGKRDDCESCPIAIALARSADQLIAWASFDELRTNGFSFEVPDEAEQFMHDFDGGAEVWPFEFTLDTDQAEPLGDDEEAVP